MSCRPISEVTLGAFTGIPEPVKLFVILAIYLVKRPETVIPEAHRSNTTDPLSGRGGPAALNPAVSLERSPIGANSEAKVEC